MKFISSFLALFSLWACSQKIVSSNSQKNLPRVSKPVTGLWLMEMEINDKILPFYCEIISQNDRYKGIVINESEKLYTNEFVFKQDSLIFSFPVFDSEFRFKINNSQNMQGLWYNYVKKDYTIPTRARLINNTTKRFVSVEAGFDTTANFNGKWEVTFNPKCSECLYKSVGIFNQNGSYVNGTFLTETGDYRFLDGNVYGNRMYLSCFDGSHAFLFECVLTGDSLKGDFYSGNHYKEKFVAIRNEHFELIHPDSITYLKPEYKQVEFAFPDLNDTMVFFPSEKYKNKVVIIQIMGSWCPNCMDETNYLASVYKRYKPYGLEIIALCFERQNDKQKAISSILRMKKNAGAEYDFLLAGNHHKTDAAKALPMLNQINAYPTTIFIDKKNRVRKIHTGYSGPATGQYHLSFVEKTNAFIEMLLNEK
jgi:thiol-disulfide isomerase/thioredoxin